MSDIIANYQDAARWLTSLDKDIWRYSLPDRYGKSLRFSSRILAEEEKSTIFHIIKHHQLAVSMHNANMGFGIGITIYGRHIYPGVPPDVLCSIDNTHLGEDSGFKEGWKIFSPIALSEKNQQTHEYIFGRRLETEEYVYDY